MKTKVFDIFFKQSYGSGQPTYYRLCKYSNANTLDVNFGDVLPLHGINSRFIVLATGPALSCVEERGNCDEEFVNQGRTDCI